MAQWNLAGMYYRGDGAPQDDAQAVRWCRRAAEQDCPPAQYSLATMYADGRGVLADYIEAERWYRRAAAAGHAKAQFKLAELYYVGRGISRDYVSGDVWCRLAAAQGHEQAQRLLDSLAPPQIPGPFDPPAPPAADTREDLFDRVRRNRIRLERGAAEVDLILDRVLPRARQLDALLNRIDDATRRLDRRPPPLDGFRADAHETPARAVSDHHELEQLCRARAAPHPNHHARLENTRERHARDRGALTPDHDPPYRRAAGRPR